MKVSQLLTLVNPDAELEPGSPVTESITVRYTISLTAEVVPPVQGENSLDYQNESQIPVTELP